MWSFVQNKKIKDGYDIDHNTKEILAYTLGTRKYAELKKLLEPFEIDIFYTNNLAKFLSSKTHN